MATKKKPTAVPVTASLFGEPAPEPSPAEPIVEAAPREETPLEKGWRTWMDAFKKATGRSYGRCAPDGPALKVIVGLAQEDLAALGRPLSDLEALLSHRWAGYLADPGHDGRLTDNWHPLHWFSTNANKYGTPWDPKVWLDDEGPIDPPWTTRREPGPPPDMDPEIKGMLARLSAVGSVGEADALAALRPRSLASMGFGGRADWSRQPGGKPPWSHVPKLPGHGEDGR